MQKETKFFRAGIGRAACAALLAGALATPAAAFAAAGFPDDDVVDGAWYVPHVEDAVEAGIVRGFPDGTFRPEAGVTRAQVAEMLCRAEGAALPEGSVAEENLTPWSDVEGGAWYTHAMNWAYEKCIFTGDGDGTTTVRPDDGISREEMAKAVASYMTMYRGADLSTAEAWPEGTTGLDELSSWAEPFFMWLAAEGVMGGHVAADGTSYLEAKGATTRAQFAKIAVAASTWEPGQGGQGGEGGEEGQKAEAPGAAIAYAVTEDSASIRAIDASGSDISAACEFRLDGGAWQRSPVFEGLSADTAYTAYARVAADGDVAASDAVAVSFRTAPASAEPGPGPSPEAVWVTEYDVIASTVYAVNGTGAINGVYEKRTENLVTGEMTVEQTSEMKAVEAAKKAYYSSMEELDAPYSDDWDTVSGLTTTMTWQFVKTGGHWETPATDAEREKLYSYYDTEAMDYPDIVSFSPDAYIFTCANGQEYTSKKQAYNSGSKIVSFRYGDMTDRDTRTDDLNKLIREAGGTPGEAWCYTGETLATMDGRA